MKELEELGYTIDEVLNITPNTNAFQELSYLIMKKYRNEKNILNNIASLLNISIKDIEEAAYQYKHKATNQENFQSNIINVSKERYKEILKYIYDILKCHSVNEIITLLSSDKYVDFYASPNIINLIIKDIYKENAEKIIKLIETRINVYHNYIKKNSSKDRNKVQHKKSINENYNEEAYEMFYRIMNDQEIEYIKEIIHKYHIPSQKYNLFFEFWKKEKIGDKTLLEHLKDKVSSNRKMIFENTIIEKIKKVLPLIDEPIQIGNRERFFDYLDFFTYFNGHYNECLQVLKNDFTMSKINNEDDKIFSKKIGILKTIIINSRTLMPKTTFRNKVSANISEKHENEVIKTIINNKFNYSNIENKLLTEEDKITIINELKDANVPITLYNFELAINKYNDGHLELITDETIDNYLKRKKRK